MHPHLKPQSEGAPQPVADNFVGSVAPDLPAPAMIRQAFLLQQSDPKAARQLADAALAAQDVTASDVGQAWHVLGMVDCIEGRIEQGARTLRQAVEQLQRHGPRLATCRALCDLGGVCINLTGELAGGLDALENARALAEGLGEASELGAALARMGPLFGRLGRLDEAESTLRAAIAQLGSSDERGVAANARCNLGFLLLQRGDFADAVPLLEQARQMLDAAGDRLSRLNCEANLAIALAGQGLGPEAIALLDTIRPQLDPSCDGYQWADFLLTAGRVHLLIHDPHTARTHLLQGLAFARSQGLHAAEIDCLERLSQAQEGCGEHAEALAVERRLRSAERRLLDERAAARVRALETSAALAVERAENATLERLRAELEERVQERTEALTAQIEERRAAEEMARFWADHDWLTRLPNRHRMQKDLAGALARARREGTLLGVLFVDLDGFKAINDSYGHLAGDRVLRVVARRLLHALRGEAQITRFGGDEFVVLLPHQAGDEHAVAEAQRLRGIVHTPVRVAGHRIALSCSIGVAMGPRDANTPDELVRLADRAMLLAKAAGRNQVRALDADVQLQLDRRGRLRRDLGDAIASGRLSCVFQPMVDVHSGRMAGAELLARWQHPELGAVPPSEFIPLAEESGLIREFGAWTLREALRASWALRQAAQAGRAGSTPGVSINLSTSQLTDPNLVPSLLEVVRTEHGQPQWIEIELTESIQLAEEPDCLDRLRQLRELGFGLALDDFGAGYSSFSYLSRLYFDRLKIDRALVHAATRTQERSAVTASIIAMAQRLGMIVVAEGIETHEQQHLLAAQGCELMQGFHIARPMALAELLHWRQR